MSQNVIQMYGADWCADCIRSKRQLSELGIEFEYLDVEHDEALREQALQVAGVKSIPVVIFPDGSFLVEPSNPAMLDKLRELELLSI
ncbi:MAG: NrdH-redoxin [Actinobacteria bacterium]|nr:NrdH-redoxin [Actinomycetota bacterium]NBY15510.1 NrdH-redoxin [Actinomycetota bacterium]